MRQWVSHNLGLKLLSVCLAAVLWAVVLGEQKVDVSVNLPFDLPIPPGMLLANDPPETLEISLRGPRTLVRSVVPREVTLHRLNTVLEEGENLVPIRREIARAPRGIEVVDVLPHRLRVVLERLLEREVVVAPQIEGSPAQGHVIRRVSAAPARVTLAGPASELDRLHRIRTVPVSVQDKTGPISVRASLETPGRRIRNLTADEITVTVEIEPRKP